MDATRVADPVLSASTDLTVEVAFEAATQLLH